MNRVLSWTALAFSATALVCAFVEAPKASAPSIEARLDDLDARLEALDRRQSDETPRRSAPLRAAGGEAVPAAKELASFRQELSALRGEVNALRDALPDGSEQGRERFKEQIQSIEGELRRERLQKFQEAQARRRTARFERFAETARLSPGQREALEAILKAPFPDRRRAESQRGDPAPEAFEERLQKMQEKREATREEIRQILDEDLAEQFERLLAPPDAHFRAPSPELCAPHQCGPRHLRARIGRPLQPRSPGLEARAHFPNFLNIRRDPSRHLSRSRPSSTDP